MFFTLLPMPCKVKVRGRSAVVAVGLTLGKEKKRDIQRDSGVLLTASMPCKVPRGGGSGRGLPNQKVLGGRQPVAHPVEAREAGIGCGKSRCSVPN